ncbi:hypothetical protein SLEP1_g34271 [Rubroshorea leprosula]|uniref:Transmembrane protein n=1 Tax=Rubroshorea leprosula TaxID=152421 RepID=A0AAV5KJC9_9ROSI|nr:hypothetical protein SLEP1_g34271 [Rubroshorea leprosula]
MEGLQEFVRSFSKDAKSVSSSLPELPFNLGGGGREGGGGGGGGFSSSLVSADQSRMLVPRPPRNVVSIMTCSKLCAVCFAAGILVGFTLKRRLRKWASKVLHKLKD